MSSGEACPSLTGRGGELLGYRGLKIARAGLMSYFAIHRISFPFIPYGEPKLPFRNDKTLTFF
jgi:hypothetical protein